MNWIKANDGLDNEITLHDDDIKRVDCTYARGRLHINIKSSDPVSASWTYWFDMSDCQMDVSTSIFNFFIFDNKSKASISFFCDSLDELLDLIGDATVDMTPLLDWSEQEALEHEDL